MEDKKKKKILFYITTLASGGLDKVVLEVLNHLDYKKYDITLVRLFPGGYYSKFLNKEIQTKANMPFVEEKSKLYNHIIRILCTRLPKKWLYKLFIKEKFDIEVACDDSIAAKIISGSTNKTSLKILWEHMDVTLDSSLTTNYSKKKSDKFFEPFDSIIGVSKDCRDKFIEKYGFEEKVSYIYNPVDVDEIIKKSENFRPKEMNPDDFNILLIGRLMPQKAFPRAVQVFKQLKDRGLRFKVTVLGTGPQEQLICEKIKELNLETDIQLLGFRENPYPYIKNADLFVCASIHESYCLVVAESLVLETPVLSTKCTGPIELLEQGKYGMLVDNDEKGLVNGIQYLMNHRDELIKYKKMSIERKDFFSIKHSVQQWEKVFDLGEYCNGKK